MGNQGYPLEMIVANIFQEKGFYVKQSSYFNDYEDKRREIDITAQITATPINPVNVQISFHIECKTPKKPWLLFTNDIPKELGFGFENVLITQLFYRLFTGLPEGEFDPKIIRQLRRLPIYKTDTMSHGITQILKTLNLMLGLLQIVHWVYG